MNDKILIIDDDPVLCETLSKAIHSSGMEAECIPSADEARQRLENAAYDLLILDINLPGMDGFAAVENIRSKGIRIPIIIISGRMDEVDALYALNIGADDYITKPFNPMILGAKAKALIRRSRGMALNEQSLITAGPFTYNTSTLRLHKNGAEIQLSSKENAMIKLFIDNVNRIFPKDLLYEMVWGESVIDDNAVMVYINRLRQKLEDDPANPKYIQNVRGIGYRFVV